MTDADDPTPLAGLIKAKNRPRVPKQAQERSEREALFLAAAGRGQWREGAFPILMESPFKDAAPTIDQRQWDPADYTKRMIRDAYTGAWKALSTHDLRSIDSILTTRIQEILDERERERKKKTAPAKRQRKWEDDA